LPHFETDGYKYFIYRDTNYEKFEVLVNQHSDM
jgi:hypothetical protein